MAGKPGVYKQTGIQKVAIFLLNAGEDYASKVFKNLSNDEIKRVATAMSKFEQISPEVLNAVTEEFNSIDITVWDLQDRTSCLWGGNTLSKMSLTIHWIHQKPMK